MNDAVVNVGVIIGSLRKESFSRRVAKALMERSPSHWACEILEIGDLLMYNQDLDDKPPKSWVAFREKIAASDALLFVTPEYNRSVPGVLKNATDIGSRPEGKNAFAGKPAAVVSVSPYATGAMAANHALRQSFVYLDLAVMQQPEAYIREAASLVNAKGQVDKKADSDQLSAFMEAFAKWVARIGASSDVELFSAFMADREKASNAYISGDPGPVLTLSTSHNPATFFPPSGDTIVSAKAVNQANEDGAGAFAKGSKGRFEILASGSGGDFAWWTGIQHADAHLKGKDGVTPMKLRTTEIFRNENGAWKLIHRHADMIKPAKE